jgi:hypothetical protein
MPQVSQSVEERKTSWAIDPRSPLRRNPHRNKHGPSATHRRKKPPLPASRLPARIDSGASISSLLALVRRDAFLLAHEPHDTKTPTRPGREHGDEFIRIRPPRTAPWLACLCCCFVSAAGGCSIMTNSLQKHGIIEVQKQLRLRMKNSGLETIKVEVTRRAGKLRFNFTGSVEQVKKAENILANWN